MENIKELTFKKEEMFFSPYACFSKNTLGRDRVESPDLLRTEFQRDRDRIMHSKSFRRLKNKTQVFLAPKGDHFRTRMTHTLDVAQIARSVARALRLNEELAEAIALGHDLGHPPFGHTGERVLSHLTGGKFHHNEQSVRIAEFLENDGKGLNLTKEVRDGILNHRSECKPLTLEGRVVLFADKIAYVNHDIDDALRAGVLKEENLTKECLEVLGKSATARINSMIMSVYRYSDGKNFVEMEPQVFNALKATRRFLFENVYSAKETDGESVKAERLIEMLYKYFFANPKEMPQFFWIVAEKDGKEQAVCDYIASMSDSYATNLFCGLFVPERFNAL